MTDKTDLLKVMEAALKTATDPAEMMVMQQHHDKAFRSLLEQITVGLFWTSAECHRKVIELLTKEAQKIGDSMGFANRLLEKKVLEQGEIAVWQVPTGVVTLGTGPEKIQYLDFKDTRISPPEFVLDVKPFISRAEAKNPDFENFVNTIIEGITVGQDRLLLTMLKTRQTTYRKDVSALSTIRALINTLGLESGNILISSGVWMDLVGDNEFLADVSPASGYEVLMTGELGTYNYAGRSFTVYTDAYRHPTHRLLEQRQLAVLPTKGELGRMTTRGAWETEMLTGATERLPGKGAWVYQLVSMFVRDGQFVLATQEQ